MVRMEIVVMRGCTYETDHVADVLRLSASYVLGSKRNKGEVHAPFVLRCSCGRPPSRLSRRK